jgi:hypothetical protein
MVLGLTFVLIMTLIFFFTRNHFLVVSSNGGTKINLLVKGMKNANVLQFLNKIDQAIIDVKIGKN